jgi:DNA-binding ferritin-like protein (Dps family)
MIKKKVKTKSKSNKIKKVSKKISKKVDKKPKKVIKQPNRDFLDLEYVFKNNNEKWLTILLMDNCNLLESYKLIQNELEDMFGEDVVYFIPIYIDKIGKKDVGVPLFEAYEGGYIFVKYTSSIEEGKFKKTDHLDSILFTGSNMKYVTNRDINKFKRQLKKELVNSIPEPGQYVRAKEGVFKNLEGKVISVRLKDKTAFVKFSKKTRVVESHIPVINLEVIY